VRAGRRVTTSLEMSGNLIAVREMSRNLVKIRELPGEILIRKNVS